MDYYVTITKEDIEHMTVAEIIAYELWLSEDERNINYD